MSSDRVDARAEVHQRASELFHHYRFVAEVAATAAVGFRDVGEQDAHRTGLVPSLDIGVVLGAPFGLNGDEFLLHKSADLFAEQRQFFIHPRGLVAHFLAGAHMISRLRTNFTTADGGFRWRYCPVLTGYN